MKNTKWYLLSIGAAATLALGSVACDDEVTACETDEDCDTEGGEVCDVAAAACEIACADDTECADGEVCCADGDIKSCTADCGGTPTGCTTDADCAADQTCNAAGVCEGGSTDCPAGEAPDANGECRPSCTSVADCYDLMAYCATDNLCYGVDTCARGASAPAMGASGPLLFGAVQADLDAGTANCTKDAAACTNNGNVCGWDVFFFDPDGDFPATKGALYGKTKFIETDGNPIAAFNVDAPDMANSTATLYGCYDEQNTSPDGGFQIDDTAGNHSNAICVSGSAP